jgi:hypothetical protein
MTRSIADLERSLATPHDGEALGAPDLGAIHRRGTRRRRVRSGLVAAAGATAVVAAVGLATMVTDTVDGSVKVHRLTPSADREQAPTELSTLAARALRDVPDATKVSPWQVVLPGPERPPRHEQALTVEDLLEGPVPLDGHVYTGVTAYPRSSFPGWLFDGVEQIEQAGGVEVSHPVGSTDMGILVDRGRAGLACLAWSGGESHEGSSCAPSLVVETAGSWYLRWWMGTEDFLRPGAGMEVFLSDDYSTGRPSTLAIAGLDGTDVATVDFVSTTGAVVEGRVESGTVVPGDSLFHANVPGQLARVVARDAAGEVIEDHPLRACDDPVDCEVR